MELPIIVRPAQSVISCFFLAMLNVFQKKQGLVKEYLLRFGLDNIMFLRAFSGIPIIPLKAGKQREVNHLRILSSYTLMASDDNKAMKSDAIDSASLAHGFAILCASAAPLLHRLWRRYVLCSIGNFGYTPRL